MNTCSTARGMKPIILLLASVVILAACAPSVKVRSDSAPDVDLSQYRTYNFFSQMGVEGKTYSSLLGQHFRDAISAEMDARGYTRSEDPELQINVSVGSQEKVKVNTYSDPYLYGGYYGYGGYGYYRNPWHYGGTQTTVHQYTEANVYVDLVDAASHKLVWQGVATFTVTDKMKQQVRQAVMDTVNSVYGQFPVPAPAN